jgi:hypothetical protein
MLKSISTLSKKRASEEDTPLSKAAKKAKRQLEQELAATATADKKGPKASQFCGDIPEAAEKEFYAKYAAGTPKLCFYDTLSKAPGYEAWINMCPNHRPGHKTGKCLLSHCGGHPSTTVIPSLLGRDSRFQLSDGAHAARLTTEPGLLACQHVLDIFSQSVGTCYLRPER